MSILLQQYQNIVHNCIVCCDSFLDQNGRLSIIQQYTIFVCCLSEVYLLFETLINSNSFFFGILKNVICIFSEILKYIGISVQCTRIFYHFCLEANTNGNT